MLQGFPVWETWRMQSQKDKFCHCILAQMQTKNLLLPPPIQEDLQIWHFKKILSVALSNIGNDYIKKFISLTRGLLSHEFAVSYVGLKVLHLFIVSKVLPAVPVKHELILIVLFTLFLLKQKVSCFSLLVCRLLEDLLIVGMAVAF